MGKNGTKRKTKWRTLPIGSGAANTADIKEGKKKIRLINR